MTGYNAEDGRAADWALLQHGLHQSFTQPPMDAQSSPHGAAEQPRNLRDCETVDVWKENEESRQLNSVFAPCSV